MIQRLLQMEFASVVSAAFLIGGFSFASRFVGLARNSIFAGKFGASETLDIYYAAFLIPDFIYQLFVLGLLSAVFIPLFSQYIHKNKEEAWHFTNAAFNSLLLIISIFVVILFFLIPYVLPFLVAGFSEHMKSEAITMSRIMLLSPVFLAASSIFGSIVQNFKRYVYYSLAPIFYNVGVIVGAVFFEPWFGVYGLAVGVIFGAFLHFFIQLLGALSVGFKYRPIFDLWHKGVLRMGRLSIARFLSIAASQLNFMALIGIASFFTVGSITIFNFANDLQYIPIGIVALSYAVAIFPKLSDAVAKNDKETFIFEFSETFRQVLFFVLPMSVLIFLLRDWFVGLILGFGNFTLNDMRLTSAVLGIFSFSIFAQSLNSILTRAFYALQNTITPFFTNLVSILTTIIFSFIFIKFFNDHGAFYQFFADIFNLKDVYGFAVLALPLAFSLGAIVNFLILMFLLGKEVKELDIKDLVLESGKIFISSLAAGAGLYLTARIFQFSIFIQIIGAIIVLTIVYLAALKVLKAKEFMFFKQKSGSIIRKILALRKLKKELPENIEDLTR